MPRVSDGADGGTGEWCDMNCPSCKKPMLPTPSGYFTCDQCDVGLIQGIDLGPGESDWEDAMKAIGFKKPKKEPPGRVAKRWDKAMKELAEIQQAATDPLEKSS